MCLIMRAVIINASSGQDAIRVEDRLIPELGIGEVRIRVAAAAVNPSDPFLWRAVGPELLKQSRIPGLDAAGIVDAVGEGANRLTVGTAVMAVVNARRPEGGAQAEFVVVPEASVVAAPDGVTLAQAATLPMTGLTALEGLKLLDLPDGATLLVTGGAGQLASFVIPLAKARGLRVIADAREADEVLVTSFGADDVVPRGDGFSGAVRTIAPEGVDAVFDTAGLTRAALPAIRDGGAIAVIRGWDDQGVPRPGHHGPRRQRWKRHAEHSVARAARTRSDGGASSTSRRGDLSPRRCAGSLRTA